MKMSPDKTLVNEGGNESLLIPFKASNIFAGSWDSS
jgi:hypothetical protein